MKKGQVSLEYLLIMAGFFSILLVLVPAIINSVEAFEIAQDTVLAERVSEKLSQNSRLFSFLGNGTEKKFDFTPIKSISVWSEGKKVFVSSGAKQFETIFKNEQEMNLQKFDSKFSIVFKKINDQTKVNFYPT